MTPGSQLSIVSGEPAAGATHFSGSLLLSITLHAAAVAVAAGSGWWMDNRVHLPVGHASNPSASAIQLTASVSQTTQVVSLESPSEIKTEEPDTEADLTEAIESPVDRNVWDQADRLSQEEVAAELRDAVRRDRSTRESKSRNEKSASSAVEASSKPSESPQRDRAQESKQDSLAPQHEPSEAESETVTSPASAESQAAIASQNIGAQVDVVARPLPTNQPPRFPAEALREGRGGRVVLKVTVNDKGAVTHLLVIKTSGHADLDRAAMDGVQRWVFEPARHLGLPVTQNIAVPITFEFE